MEDGAADVRKLLFVTISVCSHFACTTVLCKSAFVGDSVSLAIAQMDQTYSCLCHFMDIFFSPFPERAFSAPPQIDEGQVSLSFLQWLSSVTERINQTMHYQFDGQSPAYPVSFTKLLILQWDKKYSLHLSVDCNSMLYMYLMECSTAGSRAGPGETIQITSPWSALSCYHKNLQLWYLYRTLVCIFFYIVLYVFILLTLADLVG